MKIPENQHDDRQFQVAELAHDFRLEDVWEFPLTGDFASHSLDDFKQVYLDTLEKFTHRGLAGQLFHIREVAGKVFGWDKAPARPAPTDYELGRRWAARGNTDNSDGVLSDKAFHQVYQLENEFLAEISNKTVDAAMHLGVIPIENQRFKVRLGVYVRTRGLASRFYMAFIKPFRLVVIYPTMMKAVAP